MNNMNNTMSATTVLANMSTEAQALLETYFTAKAETKVLNEMREMASGLVAKLAPASVTAPAKVKKVAKKGEKKVKAPKEDGTAKREIKTVKLPNGRSGSQYIRDLDKATPGLTPKEVVNQFKAEYPELDIKESLVSNVRSQAKAKEKKAAENVVSDKAVE